MSRSILNVFIPCVIVLFTGLFNNALAQDNKAAISGIVIDSEKSLPLELVRFTVSGSNSGAVSDKDGYFLIRGLPPGMVRLSISRIGYREQTLNVSVPDRATLDLRITMVATVLVIDENIVVTATRTPESVYKIPALVSILNSRTIQDKNVQQTPELLREAVGVTVQKTNQGGGSPIIRGLKANRLLFLVDGIRMNNATYRSGNFQYLNTIDTQALERVEVVHGPNSVMYGSDALGGVINAISAKPEIGHKGGFKTGGGVSSQVSTADRTRATSINLSTTHFFWGAKLSAAYKSFGDVIRGDSGGAKLMNRLRNDSRTSRILNRTQRPNGYDAYDINARLRFQVADLQEMFFTYQANRQKGVPRYDVVETLRDSLRLIDPQTRNLMFIRYVNNRKSRWYNNITASLSFHRQSERRFRFRFNNPNARIDQMGTNTYGGQLHFNKFIGVSHHLVYGSDVYYDDIQSASYLKNIETGSQLPSLPIIPNGSSFLSHGVYIQDDWEISPAWSLTSGIRYSYSKLRAPFAFNPGSPVQFGTITQTSSALTGSLGLQHQINETISFVSNLGQGFRTPNLDDSSKLGLGKGGTIYEIPRNTLVPEKSISLDGGIKLKHEHMQANIIGYYNAISDLLIRKSTTFNGSPTIIDGGDTLHVYHKENAGKAFTTGLAVNAMIELNQSMAFKGNFSYTYGQNATDAEPLTGIAPFNGVFALHWRNSKYSLETNVRFAIEQTRLSSEDKLDLRIPEGGSPSWHTMNLRTGVKIRDHIDLQVSVANLFDRNYREHLSGLNAPGRNFIFGLSARY